MARQIYSTVSLLSLAVLSLAACQSAPVAKDAGSAQPSIVDLSPYKGLEKRVETLEGQMSAAQPTLKKVDAIESHFKALSFELGKIAETYKVDGAPVVMAVPAPAVVEKEVILAPAPVAEPKKIEAKKVEPKKVVAKAPVADGVFAVTSVRIGDQPKGITRIVLDTTKAAEIHYDLDNTEGLLVIDIPKAKWSTTESLTLKKSPMIKSFKAVSDDTGAHFVTDLKQKAKVIATARLAPSGGSGHRVYIDIGPAK